MIRYAIRAEINGITPFDALEELHCADALDWIDSGQPLFRTIKPDVPPKHLVSYFVVVDGENILLGHHRSSGLWLPSGGHVEQDEHPRDTVRREAVEELAMPAQFLLEAPLFLTISNTVGAGQHTDVSLWYLLEGNCASVPDFDSGEYFAMRWFGFYEIPRQAVEPNLGRFIAKIKKTGCLPSQA